MGRDQRRTRVVPLVIVATAAAGIGAAVAERRTVARWAAAPDRFVDEPLTMADLATSVTTSTVRSTDGASLHVVEAGTGPTAVLVHGFTATSDHWAPVAGRLVERGVRVVAFDQRGHGRSTAGAGEFTTTHLGDDLAAVIDAVAPDGAVVVGHSMGGITIQSWLAGHPEASPAGLVFVATLFRALGNPVGRLIARLGGTSLARRTMAHPVHGRVMSRSGLGREPSIALLDRIRGGWSGCPDSTRAGVLRDLEFDFTDVLTAVGVPTTVVCGDLDRVTPLSENERIAELVPDARLEVVPGAGHEVIWEAADRVADAIAELARHPGGSA